MILFIILIGFIFFLLGFYLRIKPRLQKKDQGVDTWYYLLSVEEFKKRKKIPIKLSNYLLEKEEQWYPPGFIIFLSFFPLRFLKKYHWVLNPLIDSFHLIFLYLFTYFITGNIEGAILVGLVYALTPTLIVENSTLNSRGLGNFLLTLVLISIYGFILNQNLWWLLPLVIFGFFLLMTHKMATQALIFLLLGLSATLRDWHYLVIFGLIFLAVFLFSKGFYWNILKAHKEILIFWRKNLRNLGAHQIYDAPIYKKENAERGSFSVFYGKGIKGIIKQSVRLFSHNPWIVFMIFLPIILVGGSFLTNFLFWWLVLIYFLIILTTFFPPLRFLGEGYKYIKFAIFPQGFLITNLIVTTNNNLFLVLFLTVLLLSLYAILRTRKTYYEIKNESLTEIVNFLQKNSQDGVMCLPTHLADFVTYFTQKKVLWGTHGTDGTGRWAKIEEFFPVLQKPIEYFFEKYSLNFLLLDKNFVKVEDLKLSSKFDKISENKDYLLFAYQK